MGVLALNNGAPMNERIPPECMEFHTAAQAGVMHLHLGAADHPRLRQMASFVNLEQLIFGPSSATGVPVPICKPESWTTLISGTWRQPIILPMIANPA